VKADGTVYQTTWTAGSFGCAASSVVSENATDDVAANPAVATHFYAHDHLGTAQLEFGAGGWPVWQGQFAPFGQELDTQTTANHYKFTGKERDQESGNDYFGARYFRSSMGRFMSPDWSAKAEPVPYAKLGDPQSLNLYSYVGNNPLSRDDQDGHCWPLCDVIFQLTTTVSVYVATHPAVDSALNKLGASMGLKVSAGVGRKIEVDGIKIGAAASVTTERRVDGTGKSNLQLTGAASENGVGIQANGTATFEKNGSFENPLNNLGGNVKVTGSGSHGDNINSNAAGGTDGRVGLGVGLNVGVAQAGVQVTAGERQVGEVGQAVIGGAIQDTRQAISNIHELGTCSGACAIPH